MDEYIINGRSIKSIRWLERVSRKTLSERTGIPVWKLIQYEQGKKEPGFYEAVKILEALEVIVTHWGPIQGGIDREKYCDRRFGKQPDE